MFEGDTPSEAVRNLAKVALAHDSKAVQGAMTCLLRDESTWLATHATVYYQDEKALQLMLQHNVDINSKCRLGYTALHKAVQARCYKLVPLLIKLGANVNACTYQRMTALHYACGYERQLDDEIPWPRLQVVRQLLAAGAKPNPVNDDGYTPLVLAIHGQYGAIVRMLVLEYKVEINTRMGDGRTPLMHAMRYADLKFDGLSTVRLLLSQRADTTIRNSLGHTTLTCGVFDLDQDMTPCIPAVRLLLQGEFEVDPRETSDDGKTALCFCAPSTPAARLLRAAIQRRRQWQRITLLTLSIRATRNVGTFRYSILPLSRSIMTFVG